MAPRGRGRVQVPELSPPENIRPAPAINPVFVTPAQPPIDNSLAQLQKGLSAFGKGLAQWAVVDEENNKKARLAEYEAWKASSTNTQILQGIWEGKNRWYDDPWIRDIVRKDFGQRKALALGNQIQKDIEAGNINLAATDFNIERYLLQKAAGTVNEIGSDYNTIRAFQKTLNVVRNNLIKYHHKYRGEAFKQWASNFAIGKFKGVSAGLDKAAIRDPKVAMALYRKIYSEIGDRAKKGSMGFPKKELDKLFLQHMEDLAREPGTAALALKMMYTPRADIVTGKNIGSFSQVATHNSKVMSIRNKALATMTKLEKQQFRDSYAIVDAEVVDMGSGRWHGLDEVQRKSGYVHLPNGRKVQINPAGEMKLSSQQRKDNALNAYIIRTKEKWRNRPNGLAETTQEITNTLVTQGIKWKGLITPLATAYYGIATAWNNGQDDDAQAAEVEARFTNYDRIANMNRSYLMKHLDENAMAFWEGYSLLRKVGGMDSKAALATMRSRMNAITTGKSKRVTQDEIDTAVQDAFEAKDGETTIFFDPKIVNSGELNAHVYKLAKLMGDGTGVPTRDALKWAKERIQKSMVVINGTGVVGIPGLMPTDAKIVEDQIKRFYDTHKNWMKQRYGVDDWTDIRVRSTGTGLLEFFSGETGEMIRETPILSNDKKSIVGGNDTLDMDMTDIQIGRNVTNATDLKKMLKKYVDQRLKGPTDPKYRRGRFKSKVGSGTVAEREADKKAKDNPPPLPKPKPRAWPRTNEPDYLDPNAPQFDPDLSYADEE